MHHVDSFEYNIYLFINNGIIELNTECEKH